MFQIILIVTQLYTIGINEYQCCNLLINSYQFYMKFVVYIILTIPLQNYTFQLHSFPVDQWLNNSNTLDYLVFKEIGFKKSCYQVSLLDCLSLRTFDYESLFPNFACILGQIVKCLEVFFHHSERHINSCLVVCI